MFEDWVSFGYLLSAILFVFGLKKLGHPRTAPKGNQYGMMGMSVAVVTTVVDMHFLPGGIVGWTIIGSGILIGSLIGLSLIHI